MEQQNIAWVVSLASYLFPTDSLLKLKLYINILNKYKGMAVLKMLSSGLLFG